GSAAARSSCGYHSQGWLSRGGRNGSALVDGGVVVVLETDQPGVLFLAGGDGEAAVKLGSAGFDPADPRRPLAEAGVEVCDDQVVPCPTGFADDPAVAVEDHRVAGSHFVVVGADAVAEHQEQAVVVRPRREPAHQPAAAFVAGDFG